MAENPTPAGGPNADAASALPPSRRAAREAAHHAGAAAGDASPAAGAGARSSSSAHGEPPATVSSPADPAARPAQTGATDAARDGRVAQTPADHHRHATAPLDDLFRGTTTVDAVGHRPTKKEKRRSRTGIWIALGIVVVILGGISAGGVWAWNAYGPQIRHVMGWGPSADYPAGKAHGQALVTIVSGDVPSAISKSLYEAGVTKTQDIFYQTLVRSGQNPTFYPGVYKLQKEMTAAAAITALQDPANKLNDSTLIREGLTESQILPILSDTLKIPLADLQAATAHPADYGVQAGSLEGWLFPAMYQFDPGTTAKDVIARMVARTMQSLDQAQVPQADRQRVLTIASIIQREARQNDDFYKVSRVIQNRLAQGMKLQMDSTAQYGYGTLHNGTVSSSSAALTSDNPWNTYVITGLPAGPISNPGDLAIDAAMHPADGSWLYFTTVNLDTGETIFSTTYADQEKAVAQWRTWCKANPGAGC